MLAWLSSINDNTKENRYNNNMNMTEYKAIIAITSLIVAGIVFFIWAGYNSYATKIHLENGYEKVLVPRTTTTSWVTPSLTRWVKPNNKGK